MTTQQGKLFDVEVATRPSTAAGEALKERGLQRVTANNDEWIDRTLRRVRQFALIRSSFTSDEFRDYFDIPNPTHPNAWGSLWRRACNERVVLRSGEWRKSRRPDAHARLIPVYVVCRKE